MFFFFFFFNDTATTEIYTLSLHDALPISYNVLSYLYYQTEDVPAALLAARKAYEQDGYLARSEEHTSELQSQSNLVCRLLLEKKKQKTKQSAHTRTKAVSRENT